MFPEKEIYSKDESSEDESMIRAHEANKLNILICAVHGGVYAIRKSDGSTIWKCKMSSFAPVTSIFVTDKDMVVAGSKGITMCLDLYTGNVKWTNNMSGFGYEEVAITCTPTQFKPPYVANNLERYDDAHEQAGPFIVFASSQGKIMAINGDTGSEMWRYNCPGGTYTIPVSIVELSSSNNIHPISVVYVGCGPCVYCLSVETGEVIWTKKLSCSMLLTAYMTLATPWNSRLAAEAYTSFSQSPSGQTVGRVKRKYN